MGDVETFHSKLTLRGMAISDLIDAARGHLRGEDWDKEMREALAVFDSTKRKTRPDTTEGKASE